MPLITQRTRKAPRRAAALSMVMGALFLLAEINVVVAADWLMSNHDPGNSRSQPAETTISPANVSRLAPVYTVTTDGDNWATPVVVEGAVYAPDAGGKLWKFDRTSGEVIWSRSVSEYNGVANSAVRTSVVVTEGLVIFGDRSGAHMIVLDAKTGERRWITQLDEHPAAQVTGSPIAVGERLYVGVSSNEGLKFVKDRNAKSSFRGSIVALDIKSGHIVWKTWTMPDNGGRLDSWSGGAIISAPGAYEQKGLVYFGTDHHYSQPESVTACLRAAPIRSWPTDACIGAPVSDCLAAPATTSCMCSDSTGSSWVELNKGRKSLRDMVSCFSQDHQVCGRIEPLMVSKRLAIIPTSANGSLIRSLGLLISRQAREELRRS